MLGFHNTAPLRLSGRCEEAGCRAPSGPCTSRGAPREGADKYDWRAPPLHEHAWAAQAAALGLGNRLEVLNVSHVDQRADGHVADAMRAHTDATKRAAGRDCLHYCFPGPVDFWSLALYGLLTRLA